MLHVGHIKHFEQAKKHGDILIVSVTPDRFVNKGPFKPVFNEDHRILDKLKIDLTMRPQNLNLDTYYKLTCEYENLRS